MRHVWKIKRDTTKRGYSTDQVRAELKKREPDARDFIRPQREFADVVVQFYTNPGLAPEDADSDLNVRLVLRPTLPHPDVSYLFDNSHGAESGIRLDLGRDTGRPVDFLTIDGHVTREHTTRLEDTIWRHLPSLHPLRADQFGDYNDRAEVQHSDAPALTQLLLTYHLLRVYSGDGPLPFARPVAALSRLSSTPVEEPVESVNESWK
ncbi:MAG: hypothetical protein NVS9B13_09420 [Candidatus Acidiferrum sp.]